MAENETQGERPLPAGWVWTTLGEITQPIEKVKPRENPDTRFTYLDISSIDNKSNRITEPKTYRGAEAPSRARQLVQANDVLFSTVRTYLKNIALVPAAYDGQIASTGFSVLRGKPVVSSKYLFYHTLTDRFVNELGKLQRGTSYPAVRDGDVRAQPIPLAPLPEQRRIVAEIKTQFTRLDAGMAALERAQANLRRYKTSVLKAAGEGRLVPTEAELAHAENRAYEPAGQLLARILAERRARWEVEHPGKKYKEPSPPDTENLPKLPEGWVWATMEQTADQRLGKMLDKAKNKGTLRPYLRNLNVRWFGFNLTDVQHMRVMDEELDNVSVHAGDLIVCEGGEPGRAAIWNKPGKPIVIQKALHRVRPAAGILPWYLAYRLAADANTGVLEKYFTGSTIKHLTGRSLRSYIFPLPPTLEQHHIVAEVKRRLSVVAALEASVEAGLARARRLRQSILKRAFEGQLVPQDPDDEPATVLLERIRARR